MVLPLIVRFARGFAETEATAAPLLRPGHGSSRESFSPAATTIVSRDAIFMQPTASARETPPVHFSIKEISILMEAQRRRQRRECGEGGRESRVNEKCVAPSVSWGVHGALQGGVGQDEFENNVPPTPEFSDTRRTLNYVRTRARSLYN